MTHMCSTPHYHPTTTRFDTSDTPNITHFPPCLSRSVTCVFDRCVTTAGTQRTCAAPHTRSLRFPFAATLGGAHGTYRDRPAPGA